MRTGRNAQCPCGSGKKYKQCCGSPGAASNRGHALGARSPFPGRGSGSRGTAALFDQALACFHAGDVAGTQRLCRTLLSADPNDVDALNLMGVIAWKQGEPGWAEKFFLHAIGVRPAEPQLQMNLGALYREQGNCELALRYLQEALQLRPGYREARFNLVLTLSDLGRRDDVDACLATMLREQPGADSALVLAADLCAVSKYEEAAGCLQRALQERPADADLWRQSGCMWLQAGRLDRAEPALVYARELDPHNAETCLRLGDVMLQTDRLDAALDSCRRALAIDPHLAEAHYDHGRALLIQRAISEAEAAFRQAIALHPQWPAAHWALGDVLLLQGRCEEGWTEYEWRWEERPVARLKRELPRPQWRGETLAGRTILLHSEQGMGDTIQFARYAPLVSERGAKVFLLAPRPLARLLASLGHEVEIVADEAALPEHDYYCPLASLPGVFGTRLDTIPASVPYLRPAREDVEGWRQRMGVGTQAPRVGLAWAGNPRYLADRHRSIPWLGISRLLQAAGVEWVSLQKLDRCADGRWRPDPGALAEPLDACRDFADTAALIETLDLVISVDTAVIHLAGALGKPAWLLSRFAGDWRWLLGRDDSPWYPSLRIFRQPRLGDWESVLEGVAVALESWRATLNAHGAGEDAERRRA